MNLNLKSSKDRLPKEVVRVSLVEKGTERFLRDDAGEILEIGIGKFARVNARALRTLVRGIVQTAKKHKLKAIAIPLSYEQFPKCHRYDEVRFWSTVAENIVLAEYEYTEYKSKKPSYSLENVFVVSDAGKVAREGIARGIVVGRYANETRTLANTPGGDMTPQLLAQAARRVLKGTKTKIMVLDEKRISSLKMGGLLGVGKGAKDKPRFIILHYHGAKVADAPVVFVGKGITFDTGGLQVKPGMAMYEMHMDMSGAAAVIGAVGAIATLGLKQNVVGLIPAAENAVGENAMRPGDVLTMMSGTTVDVLHTDAEGRLVLADALHYARRYKPKLVVDVATLTGASLFAVGLHASIVMTKKRALEDRLRMIGEESGDYVVPLPLWKEYEQYTKGIHADLANLPLANSNYGGAINGGMFLSHFTKGMPWVHIDMAPRMTTTPSDKLAKGAAGEPVRLLVKIAETF